MLQKLPVNIAHFKVDFIKSYNEESDDGLMFNILKYHMNLIMIFYFYLRGSKLKIRKACS